EIAEILNISEGTSKSQYSRARVYLQKLLTSEKKTEVENTFI
ncbi:MAG TPA: sigma factor-like helix-turn-helix DNA-binding protein, partial [Bacteroidia bacterium]